MTTNQQNENRLQALTPAEMLEIHGGEVTCWESPNKVINEDSVWFIVPCEEAGK